MRLSAGVKLLVLAVLVWVVAGLGLDYLRIYIRREIVFVVQNLRALSGSM